MADDFHIMDDFTGKEEIQEDSGLMAKVVEGFHVMLDKQKTKISENSSQQETIDTNKEF